MSTIANVRLTALLVFILIGCSTQSVHQTVPVDRVVSVWSEIDNHGKLQARAVVLSGECPQIAVDQSLMQMVPRARPSTGFPIQVCEIEIPDGAKKAEILGRKVPLLPVTVKRILVIGDTGCRLKLNEDGSTRVQSCNDPVQWPLVAISQSAANWKPDVVIHVGDYHYREAQCPKDNSKCKDATSGDLWTSWNEDFLSPSARLLSSAPWIFVRGNHEDCERGGVGWSVLIDPRPYSGVCSSRSDPFDIQIADHTLTIIDAADDENVQPSLIKVKPTADRFHWVLVHRPVLTPGTDDESTHVTNFPKQLMSGNSHVGLVLAGHVHTSSVNRFGDQRPPEVISGNGGTALSTSASYVGVAGVVADGFKDFGFFTLERLNENTWSAEVHDRDGKIVTGCRLLESPRKKSKLDCHQSVGT